MKVTTIARYFLFFITPSESRRLRFQKTENSKRPTKNTFFSIVNIHNFLMKNILSITNVFYKRGFFTLI